MADSQTENKLHEIPVIEVKNNTSAPFRFNAQAPEFIPRSQTQMPIPSYFYPCFDILGGGINGSEWFYTQDQEPFRFVPASSLVLPNCSNNLLNDALQQKIIKQVLFLAVPSVLICAFFFMHSAYFCYFSQSVLVGSISVSFDLCS